MKMLALLVVCWNLLQVTAAEDIVLVSTLNEVKIAYWGQRITFRCTTRGSEILEWESEEFIGMGDSRLEQFSTGSGNDVPSNLDSSTFARRIYALDDRVNPVITSELHLTASMQYPTATVRCANNGKGGNKTVAFQTVAVPADNVTLTSTLNEGKIVYSGESITFTCVTLNSEILEWHSRQYIGTGDSRLELFSAGPNNFQSSNTNQDTFAMRLNTTSNNEPPVIVSELHLTASLQYPTATIACENNGHGESRSITFHTRRGPQVSSATTLTPDTVVSSDDSEFLQTGGSPAVSVEIYVTIGIAITSIGI